MKTSVQPIKFTKMSRRDHFQMLWKAQRFTSREMANRIGITHQEWFAMCLEFELAGELEPSVASLKAKSDAKRALKT